MDVEFFRVLLMRLHFAVGAAALALFWVPALTRKGSLWHRRAGRAYTAAMAFITASGVVLALFFLADERWRMGLFLLFLGVITGTSLWNGWRVLRAKTAPLRYAGAPHVAIGLLNVVTGAALIAFGITVNAPLFYAFGPVGLLIGGNMLAFAWRRQDDPRFWRAEHFTGMIGSGIASHVAFFAFGGNRMFGWDTTGYGLVLWLAPVVVGTIAITVLNIQHQTRLAATRPRAAPVSA